MFNLLASNPSLIAAVLTGIAAGTVIGYAATSELKRLIALLTLGRVLVSKQQREKPD